MYQKHTLTAIVPCFNEVSRISRILTPLAASRFVDEIIVVDDGSTDRTPEFVRRSYPRVHLIRNSRNRGKSAAIFKGVSASRSEAVFFIDADLIGLTASHIDTAVAVFFKNRLDMLLLPVRSEHFNVYYQAVGWNIMATGERIVKKSLLIPHLHAPLTGYALEMFLNHLAVIHNWKTDIIFWKPGQPAPVSPSKSKKIGLLQGVWGDIKMLNEVFHQANVLEYLKDLNFLVIRNSHH